MHLPGLLLSNWNYMDLEITSELIKWELQYDFRNKQKDIHTGGFIALIWAMNCIICFPANNISFG
jgi:hypothetical protein